MKRLFTSLALVCMLACSTSAFAAATPCMVTAFKNDLLTASLVTGSPTIKIALFTQAAITAGPTSTLYSGLTGEITSGHGYTTGGNTLSGCSVASRASASPPAADWNCTGGLVWTATDSTGVGPADCAVVYDSTTSRIITIYTFTSATATGNGATFTITPPTIADGTRGMAYIQ